MSKIQSLEQFKLVKKSDFGFIVFSDDVTKTIHRSACDSMTEDKFSSNDDRFDWFSTVDMAEKSFSLVMCDNCNPSV